MPDAPIPPALTPDEWDDRCVSGWDHPDVRHTKVRLLLDPRLSVMESDPAARGVRAIWIPEALLPAVMALANAALPDGDPRKLTRADVDFRGVMMCFDALWELVGWAAAAGRHNDVDAVDITEARERLDRLAAKLAALLPPA